MGKNKNPEPVIVVTPPAPVQCGGCNGTGRVQAVPAAKPEDHGACNGTGWVRV